MGAFRARFVAFGAFGAVLFSVALGGGAAACSSAKAGGGGGNGGGGGAVADGNVYWTGADGLRTCSTSGGLVRTISRGVYANSNAYSRVVTDATSVYWADNGTIWTARRSGTDPVLLRSGPGTVSD